MLFWLHESPCSSLPLLVFSDNEDNPVAETEDDDCKIITEKTVFDHIREKAKNLPLLPMSNDTTPPSLEAFTLIKKRMREMHLELDNDFEVFEVQDGYRIPQSRMALECPQLAETGQVIHIIDEDGPMKIPDKPRTFHLMNYTGEE